MRFKKQVQRPDWKTSRAPIRVKHASCTTRHGGRGGTSPSSKHTSKQENPTRGETRCSLVPGLIIPACFFPQIRDASEARCGMLLRFLNFEKTRMSRIPNPRRKSTPPSCRLLLLVNVDLAKSAVKISFVIAKWLTLSGITRRNYSQLDVWWTSRRLLHR